MTPDLPPSPPEASPPAAIVQAPNEESVFVESNGYRYVVNNNRGLLPAETITRTIQLAQTPQQAIDTLRLEYLKAGYVLIAMRADVSGKLVAVEVIHGRIAETAIDPPSLAPYFTGLEDIADLRRETLIRKSTLAEFYASRDGQRPKVDFAPTKETYGGTRLIVTEEPLEGASPYALGLGFGNLGSRYSSRYTWQAGGSLRPGGGLELTGSYTGGLPGLTKDSAGAQYWNAAVGASLVTPWGLYSANYTAVQYKIGESSAPLYPQGDIQTGSLSGTQLVYVDTAMRWTVNEGYTHTDNNVTVFEGSYALTDQHYDFLTLGTFGAASFTVLDLNASVSATVNASRGLTRPRGTFLPDGPGVPSTRFTQVVATFNYVQSLPENYSLTLNWSGQWADATMPQNQQWVLGGFGNLTAWLPAALVGDSGTLVRLTAATPTWNWQGLSVSGNAFYEWGLVSLYYTPEGAQTTRGASDAGIGLNFKYATGTSATVAFAYPIASRNVEISTLNKLGRANVYFSLNQSF